MKSIVTYLQNISSKLADQFDLKYLDKYISLSLFNYSALAAFLLYAAVSLIIGNFITASVGLAAILVFALNQRFLVKSQNIQKTSIISILIIAAALLSIFVLCSENFPILVLIAFPPTAVLLLGTRTGSIFSWSIFVIAGLIQFLLPSSENPLVTFLFFTIAYLFVFFTAFLIELHKTTTFDRIEKSLFDSDRASKEKDEFISKLSHQIRTPLNNILAVTSLMHETDMDKEQKNMLDTIQASANNLVTVANSIKEAKIQKITAQQDDVELAFNLNSTIKSTLKLFQTSYEDKVTIKFNYPSDFPDKLFGNPVKIKQIFLNLIENLIKHREKDTITIDVSLHEKSSTDDGITIQFRLLADTKINLPVESSMQNTESIIEVTESHDLFTDLRNLNVIDLSITRDIIESINGRFFIRISSEETLYGFMITLKKPQKSSEEQSKQEPAEEEAYLPSEDIKHEKKAVKLEDAHILLAEDNKINQKIMRLSLQKYVNKIDFADNGKEALDMFGSTRYDLILMDVQMPVMDGIKTTTKMREIEKSTGTHTPIIAITANALLGDRESCLAAGMDDYVSKPFRIEKLIELLENHLEQTQ